MLRARVCQQASAKSPSSSGWLHHGLDSAPSPQAGEVWCPDPPPCLLEGQHFHYSIKIQGYSLCSEGRWFCSKRRRLSCGQGLHAHAGQREADEKREHHEQFSSPCPLRRLVIVNSRERAKHVQASVGLQREQQALGWISKGSGEFNQMPVPSLCW